MELKKNKNVSFWIALAVPVVFIIIILIKIVITYQVGKEAHLNNQAIFSLEEFMPAYEVGGELDSNRKVVEYAKLNSKISNIINKRLSASHLRSNLDPGPAFEKGHYGWVAITRKTSSKGQWKVIFREFGTNPYMICSINISQREVDELLCKMKDNKD